jgi:hypothetical protein
MVTIDNLNGDAKKEKNHAVHHFLLKCATLRRKNMPLTVMIIRTHNLKIDQTLYTGKTVV